LKDDPGHTGLKPHLAPTTVLPEALDRTSFEVSPVESFALFGAHKKKARL